MIDVGDPILNKKAISLYTRNMLDKRNLKWKTLYIKNLVKNI